MSTEQNALPPSPEWPTVFGGDPLLSAGLGIAAQWGNVLGPSKFEAALKALEPQLKREHAIRLRQLENQVAAAERAERAKREKQAHRREMAQLGAGTLISVAMLIAGIFVAPHSVVLGSLLFGPSLIALAKIFILRRSDPGDMKAVSLGGRGVRGVPPTEPAEPLAKNAPGSGSVRE